MNRATVFLLLLLCTTRCAPAAEFPAEQWTKAAPAEVGHDETKLQQARDFALMGGGSGYIVRGGKLVFSWGDSAQRYDVKSSTKSFGAAALGLGCGRIGCWVNIVARTRVQGGDSLSVTWEMQGVSSYR